MIEPELKALFQDAINAKIQCSIPNGILDTLSDQKCETYCRFLSLKVLNSDISNLFSCNRNAQVTFNEKP